MSQDKDQIQLLSIFHFIVAGMAFLFSCFPIVHLILGITMLVESLFFHGSSASSPFPLALFGALFTLIPAMMIFVGVVFSICLAVSGYFLLKKRHYKFCLVMAGLSCVFMPFGTVLGVFTIIVLTRPSVREMFNGSTVVLPEVEV